MRTRASPKGKLKDSSKSFGALLDDAIDDAMDLRRLQANPKLCGEAFLRDALLIANCDEARLDKIEKAMENPHAATDALKAFLRRLVGAFRGRNFTHPSPQPAKLLRAFGSEDANAQISQIRSTVAEIQAYAVRECARVFDDAFGPVEDFKKHQAEIEELTKNLEGIYARMASVWSGDDVEIDFNLTPDDRRRGLCRISFKRCPSVHPGMPDWPSKIVDFELAQFKRREGQEQPILRSAADAA